MGRRQDDEAWWRAYDTVANDPEKLRDARPFLKRWAFLILLRSLWIPVAVAILTLAVLIVMTR